ncbi:hypothetical protein [Cohnella fermenti]|uniref:Uncharacterized protein n=1 Tax=Cohnella fermenti TaxID=2565925 RepID=A0A4S4BZX1_9BACL|nr:hypothetical protein [Cohnella fermenti]THF80830.1 hypothetical protein E6C55_10130 [Cohnella fermenti]
MDNSNKRVKPRTWIAIGAAAMLVLTIAAVAIGYRIGQVTDRLVQAPVPEATQSPSPEPREEATEPTAAGEASPPPAAEEAGGGEAERAEPNGPTASPPAAKEAEPAAAEAGGAAEDPVRAEYEARFAKLRTGCQAKAGQLSGEVVAYIKQARQSGGKVSADELQEQFMEEIAASEAECDRQFDAIVADAEKEYGGSEAGEKQLTEWRSGYSASKGKARMTAMAAILAAWGAGAE